MKKKQNLSVKRFCSLAMAAAIMAGTMPATAMADTVETPNSNGGTTSVSTEVSGGGAEPTVTVEVVVEKNSSEEVVSEKTTTTTEETKETVDAENNKTTESSVKKEWEESRNLVSEGETSDENTASDIDGDGDVDAIDEFISDYIAGSTAEGSTEVNGSSEQTDKTVTDANGNVLEVSGSASGSETSKTEITATSKSDSVESSNIGDPSVKEELMPEEEQPEEEQPAIGEWSEEEEIDGLEATLPNFDNAYDSEQDITATVTHPGTSSEASENVVSDWENTYKAIEESVTNQVKDNAVAEAKRSCDDAIELTVENENPEAGTDEDGNTTYTYTAKGKSADGKTEIIKTVVVTKVKDANGNITFKTSTVTDKYVEGEGVTTTGTIPGKENSETNVTYGEPETTEETVEVPVSFEKPEAGEVVDPETGKVTKTTVEEIKEVVNGVETVVGYKKNVVEEDSEGNVLTEVEYKLPVKPEDSTYTDEETGETIETTVEEIKEMVNGAETVVGYKKNIVIKNKDGEVIGGGSETLKGTKKETTKKTTVKQTTTIDTYSQKTTVTKTEVTQDKTTETVTVDMSDYARKLIVNWLNATSTSKVDTTSWVSPDESVYGVDANYLANGLRRPANGISDWQWLTTKEEVDVLGKSKNYVWFEDYGKLTEDNLQFSGYGMWSNYVVFDKEINKYGTKKDEEDHNVRMYELTNKEGETFYGYCTELGKVLYRGYYYNMENIEDVDWYEKDYDENGNYTGEATKHIRAIALNGFWGTTGNQKDNEGNDILDNAGNTIPEVGSLEAVKELLAERGVSETIINSITAGQAMAATQAAIWKYGNDGEPDASGLTKVMEDLYKVQKYSVSGKSDVRATVTNDELANIRALYDILVGLADEEGYTDKYEATNILDASDVKEVSITAKEKVGEGKTESDDDDVYKTDVSFTLAVVPGANDTLDVIIFDNDTQQPIKTVKLNQFDTDGDDNTTTEKSGSNTTYTIKGVEIAEGVNINLSISGTQYLNNGVYVYTSDPIEWKGKTDHSQSLVGLASGSSRVDVDMNLTFSVDEGAPEIVDPKKVGTRRTREDSKTEKKNYKKTEQEVKAFVEVTKTTTIETETEWATEYSETFTPPTPPTEEETKKEETKKNETKKETENYTIIVENNPPLTSLDVPVVEIAAEDVPLVDIVLDEVPLTSAPAAPFMGLSLLSALGLIFTGRRRKDD